MYRIALHLIQSYGTTGWSPSSSAKTLLSFQQFKLVVCALDENLNNILNVYEAAPWELSGALSIAALILAILTST